jgi:hypothetical protein
MAQDGHQMIRDDTQARDPCLAAATLGSGARNVGVRLSPLAPPLTCGSSFRCRTPDGGRSSRLAHACSQNEPQQRMRPCSSVAGSADVYRLPRRPEWNSWRRRLSTSTRMGLATRPLEWVASATCSFRSTSRDSLGSTRSALPDGDRQRTTRWSLGRDTLRLRGVSPVPWTGNDLATHLAVSRERNRTGRDRSAPPTRHDSTSRDDPVRRGMRDTALARWRHGFDPLGLRR